MKRAFLLAFLIAAIAPVASADWCTDCATKQVTAFYWDAQCCMGTQNDTCFGGYEVVMWDLGAACMVAQGAWGEYCEDNGLDSGCEGNGGPGEGCEFQGGYCPPSCSECYEPI